MAQNNKVYFDHAATTPMLKEVKEAMMDIAHLPLNPSSVHANGRYAKRLLEEARIHVTAAVSASSKYQVVFTGSGTEANNLAIKGIKGYKPITTQIEHVSVLNVVKEGLIPVEPNGIVNLDALEAILATIKEPLLISVIIVSNETGIIQPIKEIATLVHRYNAILHTDASQALGKIEVNIEDLGVDLMTVSAHKFGGPMGAGALIMKKQLPITSIMQGGGQEFRFRPGTQNTLAIHGFGVACSKIKNIILGYAKTEELRDYLEEELTKAFPEVKIAGKGVTRAPQISNIMMPGVLNETQVIHFDLKGFSVSAGAACSSGKVELPYVLMAMGYDQKEASTALRISMNPSNNLQEVKEFIDVWQELYEKTKLKKIA